MRVSHSAHTIIQNEYASLIVRRQASFCDEDRSHPHSEFQYDLQVDRVAVVIHITVNIIQSN